jgi:hypothetical protein
MFWLGVSVAVMLAIAVWWWFAGIPQIRWPRGRYNGQRIVGISFKLAINVTDWNWRPFIGHYCGAFHWLCVRTWTTWEYDQWEHVRG